jgi:hypothetical protein
MEQENVSPTYCAMCGRREDKIKNKNYQIVTKTERIDLLNEYKNCVQSGSIVCKLCMAASVRYHNKKKKASYNRVVEEADNIYDQEYDEMNMNLNNDDYMAEDECEKSDKNDDQYDDGISEDDDDDEVKKEIKIKTTSHDNSKNSINITIPRTLKSNRKCLICLKKLHATHKLKRIPKKASLDAFLKSGIFIPFNCRACPVHFDMANYLKTEVINSIKPYSSSINMSKTEIKTTIEFLRLSSLRGSLFDKFKDMNSINDGICSNLTGYFLN